MESTERSVRDLLYATEGYMYVYMYVTYIVPNSSSIAEWITII